MKTMKVSTGSIDDARKRAEEEVENFSEMLEKMHVGVEELNASWEGGNHDEFVETFAERYKQMVKAVELLRGYLKSLASASKAYGNCESEVSKLASF